LKKSREAALAAVQIFNNPSITFKSESFIVLMNIAWTYLLHAYYRSKKMEYRYFEQREKRRVFDRTAKGAYKYWELERCLKENKSPVDKDSTNNLLFLIGLRHEIEHQMTTRIDDYLSAKFQACCINYNRHLKRLFGDGFGIDHYLSVSLQFSSIGVDQKEYLEGYDDLPANIRGYIGEFQELLTDAERESDRFSYRVIFVRKTANHESQADRVIEFVGSDSPIANEVNKQIAVIKETEKKKYRPCQIVAKMKELGFSKFGVHHHTDLWKSRKAKESGKGFGVIVADKQWLWYENWLEEVRKHCIENRERYK